MEATPVPTSWKQHKPQQKQELLRITMSQAQVHEACTQWAIGRTSLASVVPGEIVSNVIAEGERLVVIFTKKRVRKAKGAA